MVLKFIKNCSPYVLEDIAGINDKLAKKLIDSKYAIEYEETPKQTEIDIPEDKKEENTEEAEEQSKTNKRNKK